MEAFLLSFCSVTCCLVVMCNVHYSLFSFFGTTLISKPVSSNTDKQKEIKCPCCVEKLLNSVTFYLMDLMDHWDE